MSTTKRGDQVAYEITANLATERVLEGLAEHGLGHIDPADAGKLARLATGYAFASYRNIAAEPLLAADPALHPQAPERTS